MSPPTTERIFRPSFVRLLCVQPLAGFAICTFYLLPKFLTTELHATPSQIGLVSVAYGVAGALAVPFLGVALDRMSPRSLLLAACAAFAATALCFELVDRIGPLVFVLRAVQGLAWAVLFTSGMMLTIGTSPPERLAQAIGYYGVANLAMNAVAPAIAETIADRAGWTPIFALATIAGCLAFVVAYALPDDRPSRADTISIWTVALQPSTMAMVAITGLWGVAFGAIFIFHQPFALSLGIRQLRGFFVAFTLTAVFARVGTGGAVDRIGRYVVSVASFALYAIVAFAMRALRPGLLELLGAGLGLAHGFFFPAYSALLIENSGTAERGKLMTLSNAAFNCGLALSGIVVGGIAERSGYPSAYLVVGLATSAGAVLLAMTAPRRRAVPPPAAVARQLGQ